MWNKKDNRRMNNLCDIVLLLVVRRAPSFFLQNWSNKIIKSNQRLFQALYCLEQSLIYEIAYQRVRMIEIYKNVVLHFFLTHLGRKKILSQLSHLKGTSSKKKMGMASITSHVPPIRTKSTSAQDDRVCLCTLPSLQFYFK